MKLSWSLDQRDNEVIILDLSVAYHLIHFFSIIYFFLMGRRKMFSQAGVWWMILCVGHAKERPSASERVRGSCCASDEYFSASERVRGIFLRVRGPFLRFKALFK